MAGATGLEPATSGVTGQRCNQLYYAPAAEQVSSRAVHVAQVQEAKKNQ
ncbi:MAG: hypothetical protein RLZZ488_897 [Pseudomonadota bacterium]